MCYDKFMQQLARGIVHKFVAYDSEEKQKGCLVYLRNWEHAIFIPDDIIEHHGTEAIRMIREKAEHDQAAPTLLALRDDNGVLVFETMHKDNGGAVSSDGSSS